MNLHKCPVYQLKATPTKKNSFWIIQISVYSTYQNLGFSIDSLTVRTVTKSYSDSLIVLQLLCTFSSVDEYSSDPSVHMADLQTVKKILSPLQFFTLCNSLGIILQDTANDVVTYYLHAWGMYNWNLFVGAHWRRYCNKRKKLSQGFSLTGVQFGISCLQIIPWSAA
jgi:hypothetical protein